jgi:hypothetical protein
MNKLIKILPILLYLIVGVISMVMAFKNIFSNKFLPFHEKAAIAQDFLFLIIPYTGIQKQKHPGKGLCMLCLP